MTISECKKEAVGQSILIDEYQKYLSFLSILFNILYVIKSSLYHNRNERRDAECYISGTGSRKYNPVRSKDLRSQFTNEMLVVFIYLFIVFDVTKILFVTG